MKIADGLALLVVIVIIVIPTLVIIFKDSYDAGKWAKNKKKK